MTDYHETLRRHARIAILRFAADAPSYTTNVSMLEELLPQVGIQFTRDQILTETAWLEEQGFVTCAGAGEFVTLTATRRGVEIAEGRARHEGIKRPSPRA